MVSFPPCKINLGLHIIEKRSDSFHNLETCFYPVPLTDIVEILPATDLSFHSTGAAVPGNPNDNLCLRAYNLLNKDFALPPVSIHLHKVIPTGAGLGGGSSDAAHTLRLLNTIFELRLSTAQLADYAQQLGSDCAFFIEDFPKLGSGRGELLKPTTLSLKNKFLVLIKPNVHVSTADAYRNILPKKPVSSIKDIVENRSLKEWRNFLQNDFEESVFKVHPIIKQYKERLYKMGAAYASMSGSGSAVFGIFEEPIELIDKDLIWCGVLPY